MTADAARKAAFESPFPASSHLAPDFRNAGKLAGQAVDGIAFYISSDIILKGSEAYDEEGGISGRCAPSPPRFS